MRLGDELLQQQIDESVDQIRQVLVSALSMDALTGLGNKLAFRDDLEAVDEDQPLAVIAVELNGFKNVNTRYTHEGGDMVLNTVGKILCFF